MGWGQEEVPCPRSEGGAQGGVTFKSQMRPLWMVGLEVWLAKCPMGAVFLSVTSWRVGMTRSVKRVIQLFLKDEFSSTKCAQAYF